MNKKDQDLINEKYEQIQEGLFDRLKARGSQAVGAIKGAGQQLKGGAKQFAGRAVSKVGDIAQKGIEAVGGSTSPEGNKISQYGSGLQKAGAKQVAAGERAAEEAKYKSYIANTVKTIANDLNKLGMPVKDTATFEKELTDVIIKNLSQVTARGQFRNAAGQIGGKVI